MYVLELWTLKLDRASGSFAAVLAGLVALRLWALTAGGLELQYDEAQYWFWSRSFDWGYFSKPPLIAWAIGLTTSIFGNAEWAVRLAAPLAQACAAVALFALGRRLYGPWAGFWAGAGWLLMPAVWLSSSVISTDALLMPLWSLALLALWRLHETQSWRWAVVLGLAIGFGALAKYAMLYFAGCAALAAFWAPDLRRTLLSAKGAAAGALGLAILAPNLIWNALHSFATISHTAENAGGAGFGFNPDELLEFLSGQALVIGPVLLAAFVVLAWRAARRPTGLELRDKYLLAFAAPPLIVIMAQALISHAHANWAATAYPAAMVWIAGRLAGGGAWGPRVLAASSIANLAIGALALTAALNVSVANRLGLANAFEDGRGWRETARATAEQVRAHGPFSSIMTDHRALFFELSYYWPKDAPPAPPLRMWVLGPAAHNHAEAVAPMRPMDGARTLVVHMQPRYVDEVTADFGRLTELGRADIDLGGGERRGLMFSLGEAFAPLPRDAAYVARITE